jgi:FdrA protein
MRHVEVRRGLYRDSVRLMEISATLTALPGVDSAVVAMGTEPNLDLMSDLGFHPPDAVGPNDLVVALRTVDDAGMVAALDRLESDLDARNGTLQTFSGKESAVTNTPRTAGSAVRAFGANLVLVSTPGRYAFVEAMDALDAGASVMVFSDNVPVAQEVALKRAAVERGLLVMGPDCGTAVLSGVGLGFANVVRPGPVGLVAASGTGAQQVMTLLAWAGVGISHCLGVGGRDLSAEVGGLSTLAALDALDADPATEQIVVVSKPAAPEVAEAVAARAAGLTTPVMMADIGPGRPDLTAAVEAILSRLGVAVPPAWPRWGSSDEGGPSGTVRGLFGGGTLCQEAMAVAAQTLGEIRSNVPLRSAWTLAGGSDGHVMVDLGADEFTRGRPHPMIDLGPRLTRLAAEAADPRCRVLLLDVVLGHGAHADPARELAPAIRAARQARPDLDVVVTLVGTTDDPQDLPAQVAALTGAGAEVFASNAHAARHAARRAAGGPARDSSAGLAADPAAGPTAGGPAAGPTAGGQA